ncbi:MAG TPA: hypothetical protein VFE17_11150 [Candidatus Baltobacteraceae bacterium]|jgi:hypothetical protein|nr:hypothetical protein [Candidatus Baltobacteraceae bacterium]
MGKILIQTTTTYNDDDWNVGHFALLGDFLRDNGHQVIMRDRQPATDGNDRVLSNLNTSDFDQLWLIATDTGNGLGPADVRGILLFRDRGGGVLTARDHQDYGVSLLNLGSIGFVNKFARYNRERERGRQYSSGTSGDFQRIIPLEPVHEVLRTEKSPSGVIEYFPAHPHEGVLSVPGDMPYARVIAASISPVSGQSINLAVAIENEPTNNGHRNGRAIALSSFHHLADMNWDAATTGPRRVSEHRGTQLLEEPAKLDVYKDYIRNVARWLSP